MTPLQIPVGMELLFLLFVLVFNFALIALVVAGVVFLYRRWRGDGTADQAELDSLRKRVAELETHIEREADTSDVTEDDR